jgi:hypothetical protein
MATARPAHEHAWQLQAVHQEEGVTTEEYACEECGAVDFR